MQACPFFLLDFVHIAPPPPPPSATVVGILTGNFLCASKHLPAMLSALEENEATGRLSGSGGRLSRTTKIHAFVGLLMIMAVCGLYLYLALDPSQWESASSQQRYVEGCSRWPG